MKHKLAGMILLLGFSLVLSCRQAHPEADFDRAPTSGGYRPITLTPSTAFKSTEILPHTYFAHKPNVNLVWCATMQLAWNELVHDAGGPVYLYPSAEASIQMNRPRIHRRDVPESGIVAAAGFVHDGILEKLRGEIERKFGKEFETELLPRNREYPLGGYLFYSCLYRDLPFRFSFDKTTLEKFTPTTKAGEEEEAIEASIPAFGIEDLDTDYETKRPLVDQVRILWHRFNVADRKSFMDQEFVVELLTQSKEDRLILARIPTGDTLDETIATAMRLAASGRQMEVQSEIYLQRMIEAYEAFPIVEKSFQDSFESDDPSHHGKADPESLKPLIKALSGVSSASRLMSTDTFMAPILNLDVVRVYPELSGTIMASFNSRIHMTPLRTMQTIHFRLDESGARIKSEASGTLFGDWPTREFEFDRPFLVMLMKKGAKYPYFAMWVENTEVMTVERIPSPSQAREGR